MKNKLIPTFKSAITTLLIFISNILAIFTFKYISTNFYFFYWYTPILIVITVSIANTILWPVLSRFLMKFIIVTYGFGALLINCLIFYLSTLYIPKLYIGVYAFWQLPLVLAIATTIVSNLINNNYFDTYIKDIFKYATKQKTNSEKEYGGLIMIEIDGLSIDTLKKAIDKGVMPTVKNFIESKTHRLIKWETDLSSQTGASQAGILHGNNKNIVAYRWVEKQNNNKIMISGNLSHAPEIEKRISNGNGLLVDGISISNMFSGDSKLHTLTSSRFKRLFYDKRFENLFLDSYNYQRIFILFLWDMLVEFKSQIKHKITKRKIRLKRGFKYPPVRAGANVILREITTEILSSEILIGEIDTAYASYVGYDEVAHHSGVEDEDVWGVLKQIDTQIQRIKTVIDMNSRNYKIVILSDHGQSKGDTFKQRYKISLGNYVRHLLPDNLKLYRQEYDIDHFRDAFIPNHQFKDILQTIRTDLFDENDILRNFREDFENKKPKLIFENEQYKNLQKKYSNSLEYIKNHESLQQSSKKAKDSELIVLGSGNLGLIYFTQWNYRLTYEEIVMLFPQLIPGLVKHEGIGFILVNSIVNGAMVIGSEGIYYIDRDEIVGENPLKDFGENAFKHLKRHNSFDNMPDILVNSFYDSKTDEVCAFEELNGSHGGLGGGQTRPFILYPYEWGEISNIVGGEEVYKLFKKQINNLNSR